MINDTVNKTLEIIDNNSPDVNEASSSIGNWFNNIDWLKPLEWLGRKSDALAGNVIQSGKDSLGFDAGYFAFKILGLVIFVWLFYFSMHLGKKPVKWLGIVLSVLFIVSIGASIIFS